VAVVITPGYINARGGYNSARNVRARGRYTVKGGAKENPDGSREAGDAVDRDKNAKKQRTKTVSDSRGGNQLERFAAGLGVCNVTGG
jgi:hypothetical protein